MFPTRNCTSSSRVRADIVCASSNFLRLSLRLGPFGVEGRSRHVETIFRLLVGCCVALSRGPSPDHAQSPNIHHPRICLPSSSFATTPLYRPRQVPSVTLSNLATGSLSAIPCRLIPSHTQKIDPKTMLHLLPRTLTHSKPAVHGRPPRTRTALAVDPPSVAFLAHSTSCPCHSHRHHASLASAMKISLAFARSRAVRLDYIPNAPSVDLAHAVPLTGSTPPEAGSRLGLLARVQPPTRHIVLTLPGLAMLVCHLSGDIWQFGGWTGGGQALQHRASI